MRSASGITHILPLLALPIRPSNSPLRVMVIDFGTVSSFSNFDFFVHFGPQPFSFSVVRPSAPILTRIVPSRLWRSILSLLLLMATPAALLSSSQLPT